MASTTRVLRDGPHNRGGGGEEKFSVHDFFFKPTRLQDFFPDPQALHELCKRIMYYSLPVGSFLPCVCS